MFSFVKRSLVMCILVAGSVSLAQDGQEKPKDGGTSSWIPMNRICFYMGTSQHDCQRAAQITNMLSTDKLVLKAQCLSTPDVNCDYVLDVKVLVVK